MQKKRDQLWIFEWINPLSSVLGSGFFQTIPQSPGIYQMLDRAGSTLYVGQSGNLKERLNSYRYVHPDSHSPRLVRLVGRVHAIQFQCTHSAVEAIRLENGLIRDLKPPFNRQYVCPEGYCYLRIHPMPDRSLDQLAGIHFEILSQQAEVSSGWVFGAFRSRRHLRHILGCFQRCLASLRGPVVHQAADFLPDKRKNHFWAALTPHPDLGDPWTLLKLLLSFWSGSSMEFVLQSARSSGVHVPECPDPSQDSTEIQAGSFSKSVLTNDLVQLADFFQRGPRQLRDICQSNHLNSSYVPAENLNDFSIIHRQSLTH